MSSPWVAGVVIAGRYRLERLLGEGGMGVVWAATHNVTRRSVALKFLTNDAGSEPARRRFMREARAAAVVRHPSVIDIYDVLELEDGSPVMVMELLSGEPLADRLQRERRIRLREAASILLQVTAAVGAAHAVGVIHRDLKPENIFLGDGSSERVKVLDFGIAKLTAAYGDAAQSTDLRITKPAANRRSKIRRCGDMNGHGACHHRAPWVPLSAGSPGTGSHRFGNALGLIPSGSPYEIHRRQRCVGRERRDHERRERGAQVATALRHAVDAAGSKAKGESARRRTSWRGDSPAGAERSASEEQAACWVGGACPQSMTIRSPSSSTVGLVANRGRDVG